MKETLYTRHRNTVEPMMVEKDRRATLQALHTDAVVKAVKSHERNMVLDCRPACTPISNSEGPNQRGTLNPRSTTIRISYTPGLIHEQNQERCKPQRCADRGNTSHDVNHLFICPAHPTTMRTSDLWSRPADAVLELGYLGARDTH